jgi:hypothetical protein
MHIRARALAALSISTVLVAACGGAAPPSASETASPAASPTPTSAPSPSPTISSLLPDGIWEATPQGGRVRLTFDGARAHIDFRGNECDADATPVGSSEAVRLRWHMAMGCGGDDTIRWSLETDGLHLSVVETDGHAADARTKAILETEPWQRVAGDATLSWSDAWVTCGNPDGGPCLGTLSAGTYRTEEFEPGLTYSMPDGWQNTSDLTGEVGFLAPGYALDGSADGGSEYIVVFTSVRAENRKCSTLAEAESDQPGVARTPEAMAAEFQVRPGLVTTEPQAATIGGLHGLVMDIRMAPDWTGTCFYWAEPIVQLMGGVPPSEFDHGVDRGMTMRLYLLARGSTTLAIEVADYSDGAHLDDYSAIVEQFVFGT